MLIILKYAGKDNPNLEESIDSRVLDLVNLIERVYLTTEERCPVMDWAVIAQYFAMNILTDVAFSNPFGYLKDNTDLGYIKTVQQNMPVLEMQANISLVNTAMKNKFIRNLLAHRERYPRNGKDGVCLDPFQKLPQADFHRVTRELQESGLAQQETR